MRILIVHKHLMISGVTKFCYALAKLLQKNSNHVDFLIEDETQRDAGVYEEITRSGFDIIFKKVPEGNVYDIIFYNYNDSPTNQNTKLRKFFVHGLELEQYKPQKGVYDEDFTFGERAWLYCEKNKIETTLIRNFINSEDISFNESAKELKKVLLFSARDCQFLSGILLEICSHNNWYLSFAGKSSNTQPKFDCKKIIIGADLVIGVGRCMFEAMALGKPVVNFGMHGGDGYVSNKKTFERMCCTNGSGYSERIIKSVFDDEYQAQEMLEYEMRKYNNQDGRTNYELIKNLYCADSFYKRIVKHEVVL
jgi:hypothetical protein